MGKRTTSEKLRLQAERKAARLEARRRALRERYPDIPAQAWSNLGDGIGLGGVGGKALREWLGSINAVVQAARTTALHP
jgi:hypothetical protein